MRLFAKLNLMFCAFCVTSCTAAFAQSASTFTPNTDITSVLQSLITAAGAGTGQSAEVQIPAGKYYVSASLQFPSSYPLRIVGAGKYETDLVWSKDLGEGAYAINASPTAKFPISLANMTLSGPDISAAGGGSSLGLAPAQMSGIHATDRADIEGCSICGFYAGIVVDGNHHIVKDCAVGNDYYGLYWIKSSDNSYQDDYVGLCDLTGNRFASVACDPVAMISCLFERDHTGFEPFCFYREPGVSSSTTTWITGCHFLVCQMEGAGYCDFYDESQKSEISNNVFESCGGYGSTYGFTIPAANTSVTLPPVVCPAMIVAGYLGNTVIGAGPTPGNMQASQVINNRWIIQGLISDYEMGMAPPVGINTKQVYNNVLQDGTSTLTLEPASSAIGGGQPVEISAAWGGTTFNVQPAHGVAPVAGVAIMPAAAGQCAIIGTKGTFVALTSSTAFSLNSPVDVETNGTIGTSGGALLGACMGTTTGAIYVAVNSILGP